MRPQSQRSSSTSRSKPVFQTKLKSRVKGQPGDADFLNQTANVKTSRVQSLNSSRHNHFDCIHNEDAFNRTANKLAQTNFSHHDPNMCVCDQCQCGRHLCKFHVIKPDLPKATVYQKSFYQQKPIPNLVAHAHEYDRLQGPHLDLNSTYQGGFTGRSGDKLERPHPEDLLQSNGPSPNLTSYSTQFPGHKGDNQYVKPTDKHTRGYFPLRSKSTYANEYKQKEPKKDDYTYYPDQLKTGTNWFGNSTYGGFFSQPNPEYFAKKVKVVEKKEDNPDYVNQYRTSCFTLETTYKNDFIKKDTTVCPAKIYLESSGQGVFNGTKSKFNENADFKAMSPNFHAISTSKHSHV